MCQNRIGTKWHKGEKKMNIEKSKRKFMEYIDGCDLESSRMKRKVGHSIRVMEIKELFNVII